MEFLHAHGGEDLVSICNGVVVVGVAAVLLFVCDFLVVAEKHADSEGAYVALRGKRERNARSCLFVCLCFLVVGNAKERGISGCCQRERRKVRNESQEKRLKQQAFEGDK